MTKFEPSYIKLLKSGKFNERVTDAYHHLASCDVCACACRVNRSAGELGKCRTGLNARVSSYGPHLGEEDPLRGWRGSGTIFFSSCNLSCQYCQNDDISQSITGREVEPDELAAIMLELQAQGCHNINLVSPSHIVPQIMSAVLIASQAGLLLPIVYNTGGYDSLSTLHLLEDVIDIYMPDMKYADEKAAYKYSRIPNYPAVNQNAVLEMHHQVGDLQINEDGLATRGLLIRHLILPNNLAGTEKILRFLANEISLNTYLNLMPQYRPAYRAPKYPELNRSINQSEYQYAIDMAHKCGLRRLDKRRSLAWF